MYIPFIRRHFVSVAVVVFIIIYFCIAAVRPPLLYNRDGSLREFGIAQSRKTIIPAWLLAVLLGIGVYFSLLQTVSLGDLV